MMGIRGLGVLALALMLGACTQAPQEYVVAGRWYTQSQVDMGKQIYLTNCAICHGGGGQGQPDWKQGKDASGRYLAPPLNGSGHTWHHPKSVLLSILIKGGVGGMPAWSSKLNEEEMIAVIAFVQQWWPEQQYQTWQKIDQSQ